MKAVILGAGGQAGRALVDAAPDGTLVTALTRAQCDVTDPNQIAKALHGVDIVFNAAAYTAVDRAESEVDEARRINTVAAGLVAAGASAAGARTVHISTDFVFDGRSPMPYRIDAATAPLNIYGQTKLDGERAVTAADPDALIVRTAWLYDRQGANFLNTMLRVMRSRDQVTVVADQIGTPTLASSLAQALWSLARCSARGVHHYTDAGVASWYDFAVAIEEEARALGLITAPVRVSPIPSAAYPTAARRPAFSVLDKGETWRLTGEAPHWRTGVRMALREMRKHE